MKMKIVEIVSLRSSGKTDDDSEVVLMSHFSRLC